jgi:uncharacterized protein (TIGR03067 family)
MTRITIAWATLLTVAVLVPLGAQEKAKDGAASTKDLVGLYVMTAGEKGGEKLPAERIQGSKVRFTEDKIVATDKDNNQTFTCTYKLDSTQAPAVITMTSTVKGQEGQVAKGLIQSEGDQLRLIYSLPENLEPPTKFKTEAGQLMLVLKKTKG